MQRLLRRACNLAVSQSGVGNVGFQVIRSYGKRPRRKPFWLGRAKTKLAIFDNYPRLSPDEIDETRKMTNDYRHHMKSLYNYFKVEFEMSSDTSALGKQKAEMEKREHERLMAENRLENVRVAELRKVRVANEVKLQRDELQQRYNKFEEDERKRIEEADRIIRFYKSLPVINADNLNAAVDKCLEEEVDYNYAIDIQGNIYQGRYATPENGKINDWRGVGISDSS